MKNKYNHIFLIILFFTFVSSIYAGPKNKYGLSAARELLIPVGSVSTALGGSNLANVSGVDALHWNPSGLANLNGKTGEVLFSNQIYIADIDVNYFAGAYKLANIGTIALSIKSLSFGDIPVTTVNSPEGTGETYSPTYLTSGLSFARAMTDRISFGVTAKLIYNKISRETASGFAFDFGLNYNVIGSGLKFGVALKNLGPAMKFSGPDLEQFFQPPGTPSGTNNEPRSIDLSDFELPTALSLGLSYDFRLDKKNNLMVHGTFQNNSFSTDDYNLGLEYNFNKLIYLRGGYQFSNDNVDDRVFTGPSFGAGLKYSASNTFNIGFDYAYRVSDRFDANQFFTINLGF
ncbi:MAG: PorV/PorQ family protein [Ignavibacteria bacterium]